MGADGRELERSVARAERTMLLRTVRRLRFCRAALVVASGLGCDAEPVLGEAGDEL
jgi:hypothetical protein